MTESKMLHDFIACESINSPVLRDLGLNLAMPKCLILLNGTPLDPTLRYLGIEKKLITASTPLKSCRKIISSDDNRPVALYFNGAYDAATLQRFKLLSDAESTGKVSGHDFRTISLIITRDTFPPVLKDKAFPIYIENSPEGTCNYRSLVPSEQVLPKIYADISQLSSDFQVYPKRNIYAVYQILYYSLFNRNNDMYLDYGKAIYKAILRFEDSLDPETMVHHFINLLFEYVKDSRQFCFFMIDQIPNYIKFKDSVTLNSKYLYIGEQVFNNLSNALHTDADVLKQLLSDADPPLLIRQESGCYTSKLPLNPAHIDKHTAPRMYRLDLSLINEGRGGEYAIDEGKFTIEQILTKEAKQ